MTTETIVAQIEAALSLSGIPESARKRGQDLVDNLSRPVRVGLIGPEGSGKTSLINLLLGERLLPEGLIADVIEIVPGEAFVAEASYDDGRLEAPEEDELDDIRGAERLLIAAPHEILNDVALIETRSDLPDAVAEVTSVADIILWCTTVFGQSERATWDALGDQLRDHAFLIVTKADKLARKNRLSEALGGMKDISDARFAGLYPVATLQGLKALETKPRDKGLWDGSGAEALVSGILEHARNGRQADLDQAELFLARYSHDGEEDVAGAGRPRSRMRSRMRSEAIRRRSRPTRETAQAAEAEQAEVAEVAEVDVAEPVAPKAAKPPPAAPPEPEAAAPAAESRRQKSASLADRLGEVRRTPSRVHGSFADVAEKALTKLTTAGERLQGVSDDPGKVLNLCTATADALQTLFDEATLTGDLAPVGDDIARTGEMMTLLQLENAPGPAADAVTILLQIRRDLEQRLAA